MRDQCIVLALATLCAAAVLVTVFDFEADDDTGTLSSPRWQAGMRTLAR